MPTEAELERAVKNATEISELKSWKLLAEKEISDLKDEMKSLKTSRAQSAMAWKAVKLAMFAILLVAICVLLIVYSFVNPSDAAEITKLLIKSLTSVITVFR